MAPPNALFRTWVHSHEEDTADGRVYRPQGFPFPRSRGRDAFEVRPGGEFIHYEMAPGDGSLGRSGRWRAQGDVVIEATLPGTSDPLRLELTEVDDQRLVVKR
jgi:hypothetical protein